MDWIALGGPSSTLLLEIISTQTFQALNKIICLIIIYNVSSPKKIIYMYILLLFKLTDEISACAKGNKSEPNSINVWKHFTFQIYWCHYCEMHLKVFRCTSALWGIAAHALWLKQASEFSTAKQVSRRSPQDWDPGSICPSPDCEESVPWQILHQLKTIQNKLVPGQQNCSPFT